MSTKRQRNRQRNYVQSPITPLLVHACKKIDGIILDEQRKYQQVVVPKMIEQYSELRISGRSIPCTIEKVEINRGQ